MAFDFPSSPVADTVFTDTASGKSYQWDGTVWQGLGGGSTGGGGTPPAGDFLPLTGGTMTGDLNLSAAKLIQGGMQFHLEGTLYTAMAEAVAGVFVGVYQIDPFTQVVNFFRPPTLMGQPIVLKSEHDALRTELNKAHNAALAKITALERRIAALEKRRV